MVLMMRTKCSCHQVFTMSKCKRCLGIDDWWLGSNIDGAGSWIFSPALLDKDLQQLLGDKSSWFASLIAIGAVIGGPIGGMFVGKMGRKRTLLASNLPLGVGWFLIIFGNEIWFVLCGRILTGVAMGMISLAAPLYIAEVTHPKHRGMIGAGFQLFVTVGIFLV